MSSINTCDLGQSKCIAGIEVRTKNSDEISGQGKITGLWERFFADQIAEHLKEKISDHLYVVYSNYESDHHGQYDYLIGFEINPEKAKDLDSSRFQIKSIEVGKYLKITTEKGPMPKALVDAWGKIWSMDFNKMGQPRAFKTDFEVHSGSALDPTGSVVDIYLGIK